MLLIDCKNIKNYFQQSFNAGREQTVTSLDKYTVTSLLLCYSIIGYIGLNRGVTSVANLTDNPL